LFDRLAAGIPEAPAQGTTDIIRQSEETPSMTAQPIPMRPVLLLPAPARRQRRWPVRLELAAAILLVLGFAAIALYQASQPGGDEPTTVPGIVLEEATPPASPSPFDAAQIEMLWQWNLSAEDSMNQAIDQFLRVAVSSTGEIYAVDTADATMHLLNADGAEIGTWGKPGLGAGEFNFGNPNNGWMGGDIDFDAEGNVYVFDSVNDRIQKFSPEREFILEWPITGSESLEFNFPLGAVDPVNERVYVVTQAYPQVLVFDLEGNPITSWGGFGGDEGQFRAPSDVAVAPDGTVWISDKAISRIQHFAPDGTFLGMLGGERGGEPGQFNQVTGLAIDDDYNIYVADFGNGRVQIVREDGSVVTHFTQLSDAGRIAGPFTLWAGPDGTLYVADSDEDRVLALQLPQ
jgi:DNA-binding beta-propeller fold protein YncE